MGSKKSRAIEALKIAIEALQQEAVIDESVEFALHLRREPEVDQENCTPEFQSFKPGPFVDYTLDLQFTTKAGG
jgi:hypothetical protein